MLASKIQDQVRPVVGKFLDVVKGKHKKNDYVYEQEDGTPIKILGFAALDKFMLNMRHGTKVYIKYLGTESFIYQGETRQKLVIDARILE